MDRALLTPDATLRSHARELAAAVRTDGKGISEPHLVFLAGSLELWHKLVAERRILIGRRIAIRTLAWWAAWTIMLVCLIGFSLRY